MELYRNAPPTAIGIPTKLLPRDPQAKGATAYPYSTATQELGLLVLESCPQKKLECIGEAREGAWGAHSRKQDLLPPEALLCAAVRALRAICVCAEDYCRAQEATPDTTPQPPASAAM